MGSEMCIRDSVFVVVKHSSATKTITQSFVPYVYIPFPPLLGLLDGPKKWNGMVFTVVGAFWSLVFSRCPSRWATLDFATDTPSMTS